MNKKESILIGILFIGISLFLFNQFFLSEKIIKYLEVKDDRNLIYARYSSDEDAQSKIEKNIQTAGEVLKDIEKMKKEHFNSYSQEDIGMVLYGIMKKNSISVKDITIEVEKNKGLVDEKSESTKREKSSIEEDYDKVRDIFNDPNDQEKKESLLEKKGPEDITVPVISTKINFQGEFENCLKFIWEVQNFQKKFLLKKIGIMGREDKKGNVTVNLQADAFILPFPKDVEMDGFFPRGNKENPFIIDKTSGDVMDFVEAIPDIFMILKPTSSDNDSMMIGLMNNVEMSRLDIDSHGVEECIIKLEEKDGNTMIMYTLGEERFPKKGFYKLQLNSSDEIYMKVSSRKRNSKDNNGLKVSIINNTEYEFVYSISGDEGENGRFVLGEVEGKVREE